MNIFTTNGWRRHLNQTELKCFPFSEIIWLIIAICDAQVPKISGETYLKFLRPSYSAVYETGNTNSTSSIHLVFIDDILCGWNHQNESRAIYKKKSNLFKFTFIFVPIHQTSFIISHFVILSKFTIGFSIIEMNWSNQLIDPMKLIIYPKTTSFLKILLV